MSSGAILRAIPNDKTGYSIIKIDGASNINVIGGTLIGERDQHFGVAGEWGMGITIRSASNLAIEDVTAKNGWGDGFYIGGASRNIKFCSVIADNNRRQGMSVISVDGMVVSNSIFKNTGGTAPQAGIDIEPNDNDAVTNVQILKSQFIDNKGLGIQIYVGLNTKRRVDDIFIQGNTVTGNQAGGIALVNSNYNNIKNNLVKENKHFGILLTKGTKGNLISKNSLSNNTKIIDQGENTVSGNFYD
jgi:parallel beta-helix repeat protein